MLSRSSSSSSVNWSKKASSVDLTVDIWKAPRLLNRACRVHPRFLYTAVTAELSSPIGIGAAAWTSFQPRSANPSRMVSNCRRPSAGSLPSNKELVDDQEFPQDAIRATTASRACSFSVVGRSSNRLGFGIFSERGTQHGDDPPDHQPGLSRRSRRPAWI